MKNHREKHKIMTSKNVTFGGSRTLARSFFPLIRQVVLASLDSGFSVRVGCARGADELVIGACAHAQQLEHLAIFCAGDPPRRLSNAVLETARVVPFAGGIGAIPIRARLALRSKRAAQGCTVAVFFLDVPDSRGSLNTAAVAAAQGSQVFCFSCGFSGPPAPLSCAGSWMPCTLAEEPAWRFEPAQKPLL